MLWNQLVSIWILSAIFAFMVARQIGMLDFVKNFRREGSPAEMLLGQTPTNLPY